MLDVFSFRDFSWRQPTGMCQMPLTLNLRHGGVQVAESSVEVLKQADIIFKVNEPLLDEVGQKRSGKNCAMSPLLFECGWVQKSRCRCFRGLKRC